MQTIFPACADTKANLETGGMLKPGVTNNSMDNSRMQYDNSPIKHRNVNSLDHHVNNDLNDQPSARSFNATCHPGHYNVTCANVHFFTFSVYVKRKTLDKLLNIFVKLWTNEN